MYNIDDNDDDLFDQSSTSSSETKALETDIDSFIDKTKENIDFKGDSVSNFVFRTGLSTTLYEACARFVFKSDSLSRTMFDFLNNQTNGRFAQELYANLLEDSLMKRFAIKSFLQEIIDEKNIENIQIVNEKLKVEISPEYFNIYFGSLIKIMNHAINRNIEIYEKLCKEIDRAPIQQIVDRDYTYYDPFIANSTFHISSAFDSIKNSLGFDTYSS